MAIRLYDYDEVQAEKRYGQDAGLSGIVSGHRSFGAYSNLAPGSNNRGFFSRVFPARNLTIATIKYRLNTSAGNIDWGIYTDGAGFIRSASIGSFAAPAGGEISTTLSTAWSIAAGVGLTVWFAASDSTLRIGGHATSSLINDLLANGLAYNESSAVLTGFFSAKFPLPAAITHSGAPTHAACPAFALKE